MERDDSDSAPSGVRESAPEARPAPPSAVVIGRFLLRLAVLCTFASIGAKGFAQTLEMLLLLAVLYCGISGVIRREKPFGAMLTHFDEGIAYALCVRLVAFAT